VLAVLPLLNAVKHLAGDAPSWSEGLGCTRATCSKPNPPASIARLLLPVAVFAPGDPHQEQRRRRQFGLPLRRPQGYLMLADSEHYDRTSSGAWIALDWDRNLPRDLPRRSAPGPDRNLQACSSAIRPMRAWTPADRRPASPTAAAAGGPACV
jgi:type VI secretion system protein ImpL